jgi:hypothetical protein
LEIHNVSRQVYNTLRSFVESSDKSTYPWNVGVKLNNDVVMFEKKGRWRLLIYPKYGYFKLLNWVGKLIMDIDRRVDDKLTIFINIYGEEKLSFDAYSDDLHFKAIASDVAFVRPVRLIEIVNKLCEYAKFEFCY